ncbi:SDR family NAD(P)-dependent oxidoreductase [Anaerobacillus sp. 1_MG-2023]|uniref:SDR family NAD(P)-dependent oxidoreductase n=1 Tax=Anaerobacillus sp. 1_MG-2023 TaxID=3062655 RepID=UPI0026E43F7F|nr:SDR family oxidoreductase [Anaerobacillus sp. 1_MG-2023]MDO6657971.1 SDR family oxidoreductase [Anaerobacillus sp. 1_MG-2023]
MKYFDFTNKVAVVTGGGRGIGKTIARALSEAGATVAIVGRTKQVLEDTAKEISKETNRSVVAFVGDVTNEESIQQIISDIHESIGTINILVNNAGKTVRKTIEDLEADEWDDVMETNVKSVYMMTRAVLPDLKEGEGSRIINIASMASEVGLPFSTPYGPSKAAVVQLTKQLSQELSPLGITVNAISPGFIKTPFNEKALENPILLNKIKGSNPMHRVGRLDELIPAFLSLASPYASYTTGQNIVIDGGTTSHAF